MRGKWWVDFTMLHGQPPGHAPPGFLQAFHKALFRSGCRIGPTENLCVPPETVSSYFESVRRAVLAQRHHDESRRLRNRFQSRKLGISVPCPIEYEMAISNAGHSIVTLSNPYSFAACDYATARRQSGDFDAVLLAHPAFPTSRLVGEDVLREYLNACSWVIVDESYLELSLGGESFIPLTQRYENTSWCATPR